MKLKAVLFIVAGLACALGGYLLAQNLTRSQMERSADAAEQRQQRELAALRADAQLWADTLARNDGESLLRTFVAGISPAVLARRRESVELAAMALLRVSGVAGIHVLGSEGEILYSSDAKLTTTGDTTYRGAWALQSTGFAARDSTRPGVVEYALPIAGNDTTLAVAWLEYDVAHARDAARPESLGGQRGAQTSAEVPAEAPAVSQDVNGGAAADVE